MARRVHVARGFVGSEVGFSCGAARIVGLEEKIINIIVSRSVQDPDSEQMGLCQRRSLRCTDEDDKTIWAGDVAVCIKKA
jgi:hypothetical protein